MYDIPGLAFAKWGIRVEREGRAWEGMCPFEGVGEDRFVIWEEGNYWCHACGVKGWLVSAPQISEEQRKQREQDLEAERQKRLAEWKHYNHMEQLIQFHDSMRQQNLDWWAAQGIKKDLVDKYLLGFNPHKVVKVRNTEEREFSAYTIPIFNLKRTELENIQSRLIDAPKEVQKYRQERRIPAAEFYASDQTDGSLLVVEGSKKAIVISKLVDYALQVIGIPGISCSKDIIERMRAFKNIFVIPDPGAEQHVQRFADILRLEVRRVSIPVKVDDAAVQYHMTKDDLRGMLKIAKTIVPKC